MRSAKDKIKEIENDLNNILDLKNLFLSKGGEQLVTVLRNNCAQAIYGIVAEAEGTPNSERIISLAHKYSANLSLLASFQDIALENEIRNQLDQAIQEMKSEELM